MVTSVVASALARSRDAIKIFCPFSLEFFQTNHVRDAERLLKVFPGEEVVWAALELVRMPSRRCSHSLGVSCLKNKYGASARADWDDLAYFKHCRGLCKQ